MKLKDVQFYGRAAADVVQMFGLSADLQDFQGCRVLDCPGGPSSFTATLAAAGTLEFRLPEPLFEIHCPAGNLSLSKRKCVPVEVRLVLQGRAGQRSRMVTAVA